MSLYPTYRETERNQYPWSTPSNYPANLCRTMAPTMYQLRRVIGHHFAKRHGPSSPANVRGWIEAYRGDMRACGWNLSAKAANAAISGTPEAQP
jgi:hypothetical protein